MPESADGAALPIKRIDIREFRERGYLQEANRRFFHPLGLALEVIVPEPDDEDQTWRLGGVWDYRDDPEGMMFNYHDGRPSSFSAEDVERGAAVDAELAAKAPRRMEVFGSATTIEPLE